MKILMPVEDEKFADLQTDFFLRHEWSEPVSVCVFNVIHEIHPVAVDSLKAARHYADALVKRVVHKIESQCPYAGIQIEIAEGHASEAILRKAAEWDAGLIVLGSHGRTGVAHAALGSVAYEVLAASPCAIIILGLARNKHLEDEMVHKPSFSKLRSVSQ
ncbi:MAG: universal stress protein [Candidatus Melainabacteria bacterium]|nr:universal stress protein [Candidatus Melainabacteria bacterium]